jgi:hypothetical protein
VIPRRCPPGYHVRRAGRTDGLSQLQRTPLTSGALLTQNFAVIAEPGAAPLGDTVKELPAVAPTGPAVPPLPDAAVAAGARTLSITPATSSLAADGRARTVVTVSVTGADGVPASGVVHVRTSAGQLLSSYSSDVLQGTTARDTRRPRVGNPCATSESGTETPASHTTGSARDPHLRHGG